MEKEIIAEKPTIEEIVEILVRAVDKFEIGQHEMRADMREGFQKLSGEIQSVRSDLKADIQHLDAKIERVEANLESKLDDVAETLSDVVSDHETRITALEKR